jgi:O-methyltransferase
MKTTHEDLYLDLLKKALAFTLWPEPPIPIDRFDYRKSHLKRLCVSIISRILKSRQLQLVKAARYDVPQREEGRVWPGYAHTMIGLKRLDNIQYCIQTVIREGIAGDLMETGVWRGGACIFMRAALHAYAADDRKVYVADSFTGLPEAGPMDSPHGNDDLQYINEYLSVSQTEVENNFRRFGLLDDQVVFLKGWFKESLPGSSIENLAVLRVDGDLYSSTMDVLTRLYPKLSARGFCIIDDYALSGCRKAVDDFRKENRINSLINAIDWTGIYWRKE